MRSMFSSSRFNGDISRWDVSSVEDMSYMFADSLFNGDISEWDVSNVRMMDHTFSNSKFNGDLSKWNVSRVRYAVGMFYNSRFEGDISNWDMNDIASTGYKYKKAKHKKDKKAEVDSSKQIATTSSDLSCHVRKSNTPNTPPGEVYMGEMPSKDPEKKKLFWIERPYLLT